MSASPAPRAMLHLVLDSERLLGLSNVPLLFGLPSVLTTEGRGVVVAMLTGKVRIRGLRHLGLLRQFTTVLNTAP